MHPVVTFVRQKLIVAVLSLGKAAYKISGGRFPAPLFSMSAPIHKIPSDVKIIGEDENGVTVAKVDENGKIRNGDFKILSTSDLHLTSPGYDKNNKSVSMLVRQIEDVNPDLIVFTGDIVLSDFQQIDAIQFSQMMERLGIYWVYVFGNHEAREEKEYFKYLLFSSLQYYPHCLSRFGDPALYGYGNFTVNILNGEKSLQQSLFCFDSGRSIQEKSYKEYNLPPDMKGYDFLKKSQIEWYKRELAALRFRYGTVKSMMYMHIPLPEYQNVFSGTEQDGFSPTDKCRLLYGTQYEYVGCSHYNSGMFAAIKELGSTQAVFSGHDHINDFCAQYEGVYLVYNQCGGYNTYDMNNKYGWDEKDCHQGVTVTLIHPDGGIEISQRKNSLYL